MALSTYTHSIHTHMANFNPADIEKALQGMNFPGDKQAVLAKARENNAKQEELDALKALPERQYANSAEVTEALGEKSSGPDEEM